jgi:hypothetical protein
VTFCSVPLRDYFLLRAPSGPLIPFGDMGTLSGTHFQKLNNFNIFTFSGIYFFIWPKLILNYEVSTWIPFEKILFITEIGSWKNHNFLKKRPNQSHEGSRLKFFATYFSDK